MTPSPSIPSDEPKPLVVSRETKRQLTRQRVLEVALEVFRETHFEEASTSEIARRAKVSHGTVFTVEPTKERLAAAAFDGQLRRIGEKAFAAVLAKDPSPLTDQLMQVFSSLFDFYETHRLIARILLREMLLSVHPKGEKAHDRLFQDYLAGLTALVNTAATRGEIQPEADVEALVAAIFGVYLVFLLGQLNNAYPDKASHRAMCHRALEAVILGSTRESDEE